MGVQIIFRANHLSRSRDRAKSRPPLGSAPRLAIEKLVTVAPILSPMPNGKPLSAARGAAEFALSAIAFRHINYWLKPRRHTFSRLSPRAPRTTREQRLPWQPLLRAGGRGSLHEPFKMEMAPWSYVLGEVRVATPALLTFTALSGRRSAGVVITKFSGHTVTFRSSPTVCADIPMFRSASTRIFSGKPPRAMWSAAMLLGLYRMRSSDTAPAVQVPERPAARALGLRQQVCLSELSISVQLR
jgi:hypothetical protein